MGCILEITTPAAPLGTGVQDLSAEPLPIQRGTTGHKVPVDVAGCWRSLNTGAMFWMTEDKVSMTAQALTGLIQVYNADIYSYS